MDDDQKLKQLQQQLHDIESEDAHHTSVHRVTEILFRTDNSDSHDASSVAGVSQDGTYDDQPPPPHHDRHRHHHDPNDKDSGAISGTRSVSSHDSNSNNNSGDMSGSVTTTGKHSTSSDHNRDAIFRQGGGALSGARCCFILTLIVAACALATIVSLVATNEEVESFNDAFVSAANTVIESSDENVRQVFDALEVLSLTSTTFIKQQAATNAGTYPPGFMTIPHTEQHMGSARVACKADFLTYVPDVASGQQDYDLWAEYAQKHKAWIASAYEVNPTDIVTLEEDFVADYLPSSSTFYPLIWEMNRYNKDGDIIPPLVAGSDGSTLLSCTDYEAMEDANPTVSRDVGPKSPNDGPFAPLWLLSPPPHPQKPSAINFDMQNDVIFHHAYYVMNETRNTTFQDLCGSSMIGWFQDETNIDSATDGLYTMVSTPAFADYAPNAPMVGAFLAVVPWNVYFTGILANENVPPVVIVMESECRGEAFTYQLYDGNVTLLDSTGDAHNSRINLNNMAITIPFAPFAFQADEKAITMDNATQCSTAYTMTIYPTTEFEAAYSTSDPLIYTLAVLGIFMFTSFAFFLFDCLVQRRQQSLISTALRQNTIVSSLFPKSIQKKLMEELDGDTAKNKSGKAGLRMYLNDTNRDLNGDGDDTRLPSGGGKSKPIADLFPETTIMFADIAGFTAWSSTREPSQVFILLEAIYHEFDTIAKRRRVFKVEVVGDCYVAVCGLPDPRRDHAVVMARFATECLSSMYRMVRKLEVELGPDTAELGLRVGLHSGPVVAGVLRGDRSRFQLFGDTMNTASRMESTGTPNRIQVSPETADLIRKGGKESWLKLRENKVLVKGKGEFQTYWLDQPDSTSRSCDNSTTASFSSAGDTEDRLADPLMADPVEMELKRNRVAEWTVEVLASVLKVIVAARKSHALKSDPRSKIQILEKEVQSRNANGITVIDEVAEIIELPDYNARQFLEETDTPLDGIVMSELRNYVQTIASLYNPNAFHNFDHANHVVMSVNKLLSRIVAPDLDAATEKALHDHTYGITSDPLTWFAVVFSALIHDVDHTGIPNAQLVKEGAPVASLYNNVSVAEQNSVDLSWDLLMEPAYCNLRYTIYSTIAEFKRFRQLVVNSVMATDIMDKEMKTMRSDRWDIAFDPHNKNASPNMVKILKSTIVIEHLIQASDVAHTMQHWHIYRRWNEKFFTECYAAYLDGRAEKNPADTWYEGEKGFFDYYIIPLAMKLKECGVFGVSSDEYLSYAIQNRQEWEKRGEEIVKEMLRGVTKRERRSSGDVR